MNHKTLHLVYIALAAVLIAVCSWICIPTLVPFTMQTFAVFCTIFLLGGKRGTAAVLVYLALGCIGVPVFAQFTSGIGILLGTTGGYMVGFLLIGLIYWAAVALLGKKVWVELISMLLGLLTCYARTEAPIGLATALAWCVFPFVIPDLCKLGLAFLLAKRIGASRVMR